MKVTAEDYYSLRRLFPKSDQLNLVVDLISRIDPLTIINREIRRSEVYTINDKEYLDITGCLIGDDTFVDYYDCINLPFVGMIHAIFGNQYSRTPRSDFKVLDTNIQGRAKIVTYDNRVGSTFTLRYECGSLLISFDLDTIYEFTDELSNIYSFSQFLLNYLSNKIIDQFVAVSVTNGFMFHRKATLDYKHIMLEIIHALTDNNFDSSIDKIQDVSTQLDDYIKSLNPRYVLSTQWYASDIESELKNQVTIDVIKSVFTEDDYHLHNTALTSYDEFINNLEVTCSKHDSKLYVTYVGKQEDPFGGLSLAFDWEVVGCVVFMDKHPQLLSRLS